MRLATTTALYGWYKDEYTPGYIDSMKKCLDAGFTVQDVNFCPAIWGRSELAMDDWESRIAALADSAAKNGVEFCQSHPVFLTGPQHEEPEELWNKFTEMMKRSIIASEMLGIERAVIHPVGVYNGDEVDIEKSIKLNIRNFDFAMELARKHNVMLSYENMPNRRGGRKRFASRTEELIALLDEYDDDTVGVCWDFGHGNIIYDDQAPELRALGSRLKMTHVADNYKFGDDHMLPFHGSTDWHSLVPVLSEIGYDGDFVFETHMETVHVPLELREGILETTYKIGEYLMTL